MRTNLIEETFTEVIKPKKQKAEDTTIHIIHILDASSSMHGAKFKAAKSGMDEELSAIKEENNSINYTYSVIEFGSCNNIKTIIEKKDARTLDVKHIPLFSPSGMTALYDAIGYALTGFKCEKEDKVIVKIFTDGEENNSCNYSGKTVKELISSKESEGWVITFVGTDRDVEKVISTMGVTRNNTLKYDGTAQGLRSSYSTANSSRAMYAKAVLDGNDNNMNFFQQN